MTTTDPELALVTAHVLFIDIVDYSTRAIEEQHRLVQELQELVRQTREYQRVLSRDDCRRLATGDGMAIVCPGDPVSPLQCAIELAQLLRGRPHLPVRMGLHRGPVCVTADINDEPNFLGDGINLAERAMDSGDAGHILLSRQIVDELRQVGAWPVYDLGFCKVKNSEWMNLFNFCTTEVGNPRVPEKLRSGGWGYTQPPSPTVGERRKRRTSSPQPLRVVLLYERGAATAPSQHVLQLLEAALGTRGHRVFVDRHLDVGIEWAREIDDQIRASDAVIPLLSAGSAESEMLAHELQTAHEAAHDQYGRPALLPVRVAFTDPLPATLDAILDPWEGAVWAGPEDDKRLVTHVLDALSRPLRLVVPPERLPSIGGAMPLDSPYYVARPADQLLGAALARGDSIILIKGARQMGKTSLLARGLHQARERGARVVQYDFQKLAAAHLESPEAFFQKLAGSIADQLDLAVAPEDAWKPHRDPAANFERFWRRECLGASQAPIVWALDEVDRLFGCPFSSEVFGLFRAWHNGRALEPDAPWHRLTLLIAYATEASLFIRDLTQSPFNVGTKVTLDDFTPAQVAELNARYGSPLRDEVELHRFTRLLGGHPYLVHRGLHQMITTGLDLDRLEAQADREDGIYGDHLRRILTVLARDPELCAAVRGVLRGEPCPDDASLYRLCSGGLMVGSSRYAVCARCQVYESYLSRHLL